MPPITSAVDSSVAVAAQRRAERQPAGAAARSALAAPSVPGRDKYLAQAKVASGPVLNPGATPGAHVSGSHFNLTASVRPTLSPVQLQRVDAMVSQAKAFQQLSLKDQNQLAYLLKEGLRDIAVGRIMDLWVAPEPARILFSIVPGTQVKLRDMDPHDGNAVTQVLVGDKASPTVFQQAMQSLGAPR